MNPRSSLRKTPLRNAVSALIALAACWLAAVQLSAQTAPARPRIGLALGGGAARGFAHIGVLKWFVEHRIPIDFIAGTSMGGLIGGGFAAGMSPDDVEALVASLKWDVMLAPGAPFADKTFRRKEDARAFPSRLAFGLRGGFSLPGGLSTGHPVELMLGRIAMPYYAITSFDELPTPFRCVAADLNTADVVVFDRGWLAQAMRATMALPGVFAPVTIGKQKLVDGGVLNNVPADVVAGMGADVVIAVDVSADLRHAERGDSLLTVLWESLDVMMRGNTRRALSLANIVIAPDLKGFWGTEFDRADDFAKRGYAAAEAHRAELERYALSQPDYDAYVAARASRRRTQLPAPSFVEVEGVPADEAARIRHRFDGFVLRPFDEDAMERELAALMGTERYVSVTHRLVSDGQRTGIIVTAAPKTNGPPFLVLALDLRNNPSTGIAATGRGRIVVADVGGSGTEARIDFAAGTVMGIGGEWYQPLGRIGFFAAPHAAANHTQFDVFDSGEYKAEYREASTRAGVDAGYTSGNHIELRVGYEVEHLDGRTVVGEDLLPRIDGTQAYFRAQAAYDGQTGPMIPESGAYVRARMRRYTRTALASPAGAGQTIDPSNLLSGDFDSSVFLPAGSKGRVFFRAAGGTSFSNRTVINDFSIGGPFSLGALNEGELRGSHFLLANAGYLHQVYRFADGAAGSLYAGGWIESGSAFERFTNAGIKTNISGGFVIETPLGPILAAASVGVDGRYRFYAGLGPLLHR